MVVDATPVPHDGDSLDRRAIASFLARGSLASLKIEILQVSGATL
jgi:hypothetical protein